MATFTTFGPEDLETESERFSSAGMVLLGERLYMVETAYQGGIGSGSNQSGYLRTFDVSDPMAPQEVAEKETITFPLRDIAGEEQTLAVVTGSRMYYQYSGGDAFVRELVSTPGNLLVYDVAI